jgi:hyperosmotically inducible periplasmic protein
MRTRILPGALITILAVGTLLGCSNTPQKSPDVSNQIRNSLDQAGLKDVSVSQDRDKGVITLTGTTSNEGDKGQAESIAKSIASSEVISNQIAVRPPADDTAKEVDSDTDKGIEKNLDAVLIRHKLNKDVSYHVKNGVVTLKGEVHSKSERSGAEKLASHVPNVKQVVNELEVKNQKATSQKATSSSD